MARTPEQQAKSNDRALARRQAKRRSQQTPLAGARDTKTGERYEIAVLPNDGTKLRRSAPVVEDNLRMLKTPPAETIEQKAEKKRIRYAAMRTHQEIAANVIAAGGNATQAARKAGVSRRQVRKYMESADFRERVAELQEVLGNAIRGRVMKEIGRRTGPKYIQKMELLDVLRVGDRFGLGRGSASVIVNDHSSVQNNYEANFNALFHAEDSELDSDSEEEGADFPEFEPTSLALSGGDPSVEG
jgi:hypothetical protein